METSVPDIYACGDCVETVDACTDEVAMFQLKHNAIEQGQIVARNILGENVKYLGAYTFARRIFSIPMPPPLEKPCGEPTAFWAIRK